MDETITDTRRLPVAPDELRRMRERYGTQAEAAEALGISLRMLRMAETEEDYPRRRLLAWAIRGLLASIGR